jgi:ABC-type multidrug transport system ATPase subunit
MINGRTSNDADIRRLSTYVEQEDAMIGILTLRETIEFAARLSKTGKLSKQDRASKIEGLIDAFGLRRQVNTIVGTPLRKGLSGGQKRRLSVASQLVTGPRIVFLDEPTSGLDSAASYECMDYIKQVAKQHNLIIICSIHQPSTTTFQLFDQLMLLSQGRTCYSGPVSEVQAYFERNGHPIPRQINPAEFLLDLVNNDFVQASNTNKLDVADIYQQWDASPEYKGLQNMVESTEKSSTPLPPNEGDGHGYMATSLILLHRNFIKSYRDFIAYGTRVVMYFGLAIMMGTVWLRLSYHQSSIQPFINAIFFGGAFMVSSLENSLEIFPNSRSSVS